MEINKTTLEEVGYTYKKDEQFHPEVVDSPVRVFETAEKGCIVIKHVTEYDFINKCLGNPSGYKLYIEYDHDASNESAILTLDDLVSLDKILNKG